MNEPIQITFFGGVNDGGKGAFTQAPQIYDYPHKAGDRGNFTRYVRSDEWSQHFGKLVFIPQDFPGRPPKRELQAA